MTTVHAPCTDKQQLRRALSRFATGVTVVTTKQDGIAYGLTVNSFASVSLDPPLVLWCIHRRAASLAAFSEATHFAINVLSADQAHLARRFSQRSADRFEGVGLRDSTGDIPVLDGSVCAVVCRRRGLVPAGDHIVILGEVVEYEWSPGSTLLFLDGSFSSGPL